MTIQLGTDDCEAGTLAGEIFDALFAAYDPPGDTDNIPLFKKVAFAFATGQYEGLRSQIADGEAIVRSGLTLAGGLGGGAGEVNTASNLGTGAEVFANKVGVDLRFRSLVSADGSVTITEAANDIDFVVDASVVDHGGLAGLGDDDHTQYLLANGSRPLTGAWNAGAFQITSGSLIPAASATYDLGETATRWRSAFLSAALYVAGGVTGHAAAADDVSVGDGSGTARGQTFYSTLSSQIYFADTLGGSQGGISYTHSGDTMTFRAGSTNVAVLSSSVLYPASDASYDLGILATNRWQNGYFSGNLVSARVFTGGATSTTGANVGGDDLIIGTTATAFPGMSILSTNTGVARVLFGDSDDADVGGLVYDHTSDVLAITVGGGQRFNLSAAALYPQSAYELGLTGSRWSNGYMGVLYLGGAVSGDGNVGADELVIGSSAATARGITVYTGTTVRGSLYFADTSAGGQGGIGYDHSVDLLYLRAVSADRVQISATAVNPVTTAQLDLGQTSNRWVNSFIETLYLGGASSGNGNASGNELVIGDGTAAARGLTVYTANSVTGGVYFADSAGGGQGALVYYHSTDVLALVAGGSDRTYISSGATYPATTNAYDLGLTGTRWRSAYFSAPVYVAGGVSGHDANADDLVVGDGGAGVFGMTFASTTAGAINFADTLGGSQGRIVYLHSTDTMSFGAASADQYAMSATALYPSTDNARNLGISGTNRWQHGYFTGDLVANKGFLASATTTGSVDAAADDLVIGTTASTAPGISLVGTNTSTHSIYFADSDSATTGGIIYGHTLDEITFRAKSVSLAKVTSTALAPVTDGVGTLGTDALGWDQLWFSERAGAPTSAASRGALYVDDRAPNALWFLDDTGAERNISRMPSITLGAERSEGVPAISVSINSYLHWRALPATGTTYLVWMIQVPYTYDGQPLTLRVAWAPGSTAAGNVRFRYHIRRYVAGESQIVSNASTTDISVASGGTANIQQIDTLTTSFTLDSAVAGDTVTIALIRLGDDGSDTLTGSTANVHYVVISETVT